MFWLVPLIGAGLGAAKGALIDQPAAKRQRAAQAQIARWSPYTGMQASIPQDADVLGSTLQGGMGGMMLGQNMQTSTNQNQLAQLQRQYMENQNKLAQQQMAGMYGATNPVAMNPQGVPGQGQFGMIPYLGM